MISNHTDVEFKFNTGSFEHTLVTGFEYSKSDITRSKYTVDKLLQNIWAPNPYRPGVIHGMDLLYDASIETIGGYIEDTIKLNDQWFVSGGVRIDGFERDQVGGPTAPQNTAKRQDTLTNWHTGIVYKPIPIASIYGAYATAQTPIGGDLDSTGIDYNGLSASSLPLEPEESTGIEVGTKWELFNRRLLATAALFQTTISNARTDSGKPEAGNAGKYRVQGLDLGVSGNITDAWSVFGGIVLTNSEVLRSDTPEEVGRGMANVPHTQFSLLSSYKLNDKLRVGGQAIYSSQIYAGYFARNDTGYHTTDYWRFDAFADYKLTDHLSLELQGLNLTDELYYDALYRSDRSFAFVAPGRAGYLTVKWKY
jgi:catecholate siderophore receptor